MYTDEKPQNHYGEEFSGDVIVYHREGGGGDGGDDDGVGGACSSCLHACST